VARSEGERPALVLVSDRNAELVKTYGVEPREINGATYASRATFVIDKQGVLRYVNYEYKVREDYEPLLKVLSELK
jgi:peroxiredoxin